MKNSEKRHIGVKPLSSLVGGGGNPNPNGKNGKPFSLAPLTFDQALRKILTSPPEPKPEKKKAPKKTTRKK